MLTAHSWPRLTDSLACRPQPVLPGTTESGLRLHCGTHIQMFINSVSLTQAFLGLLSTHKLPREYHWLQNISLSFALGSAGASSARIPRPFWGTRCFLTHVFFYLSFYFLKFLCTWSMDLLAVRGACQQDLTSLCGWRKSHLPFPRSQWGARL